MLKKPAKLAIEKVTWDCAIVKNHHSAIMMSAWSNGSFVKGPFIGKLGLTSIDFEGKSYDFPDNRYPFPMFHFEPGQIVSEYWNRFIGFLNIKQELVAVGEESFILRYVLHNNSHEEKSIGLKLRGQTDGVIPGGCRLNGNEFSFDIIPRVNGPKLFTYAEFYMEENPFPIKIIFPSNGQSNRFHEITQTDQTYETKSEGAEWYGKIDIPANNTVVLETVISYGSNKAVNQNARNAMLPEWQSYSEQIPPISFSSDDEQRAYYKAWSILYFNEVKRNNKQWVMTGTGFGSMWIWDTSPFIINAYLKFKPEWAKEMVRQQVASIRKDGFMPLHALTAEYIQEEPQNSITQIPLVPDSVMAVYQQSKDRAFLEWAYPLLVNHYNWFEKKRKPDTAIPLWIVDDYRKPYFSGAESGMDNSPIYQGQSLYAVAQNAAKFSFEQAMQRIADVINNTDEAGLWLSRKEDTQKAMETLMWSEADGFYFPLTLTKKQIKIKTSDVYPALYYDCFKADRIKRVIQCLQKEFITEYGLTTVSQKEKLYVSGNYFQGAVWPCMNYMAFRGLLRHGYKDLASLILDGTVKAATSFPSIYECYDAERKTPGYYNGPVLPFMSFCAASLVNMLLER